MARRFVDLHSLGGRVWGVKVLDQKMLDPKTDDLSDRFVGRTVQGTARHGKNLFIDLGTGYIHIHLGMSGSLHFLKGQEERTGHERLRITLDRGALVLDDPRRFGRFGHVRDVPGFVAEKGLGPDALSITDDEFVARIGNRRGAIKPLLLDQGILAGVGNLYADEVLFQEKVHPRAIANELSARKLVKLRGRIGSVLNTSISVGTDFSRLPSGYLLRQREVGGPCPVCVDVLISAQVGGRTSVLCPSCQMSPSHDH